MPSSFKEDSAQYVQRVNWYFDSQDGKKLFFFLQLFPFEVKWKKEDQTACKRLPIYQWTNLKQLTHSDFKYEAGMQNVAEDI